MRTEEGFDIFWSLVMRAKSQHEVSNPCLPRPRKRPARFEEGNARAEFHEEAETHYRQIYYEALDTITSAIKERFDQDGYNEYIELENLLVRAWNGENFEKELQRVCEFYKDDLDEQLLVSQLMVFQANKPQTKISTFKEVWEHCKSISKGQKSLLMQTVIVLKLLLVMPATNAVSERSFSGLRRIKTYLRTTMKQSR